jgi:hypothetical protein
VWWLALRTTSLMVTVLLFVVCLLFGTVGIFAVGFDVSEAFAAPLQSYELPNLACEVTGWGGFGTDSGYAVVLYRKWSGAPWLRVRLREARVDETASDPDVSCADLDNGFRSVVRPLYSSPSSPQAHPPGEPR